MSIEWIFLKLFGSAASAMGFLPLRAFRSIFGCEDDWPELILNGLDRLFLDFAAIKIPHNDFRYFCARSCFWRKIPSCG